MAAKKTQRRIFLHTEEIDAETIKSLMSAGYLPIRVKDVSSVRIIEPKITVAVGASEIDAAGAAALNTIIAYNHDPVSALFARRFIELLKGDQQ